MRTRFAGNQPLLVVTLPAPKPLVVALRVSTAIVIVCFLTVVALEENNLREVVKEAPQGNGPHCCTSFVSPLCSSRHPDRACFLWNRHSTMNNRLAAKDPSLCPILCLGCGKTW